MDSPARSAVPGPWIALRVVALLSFAGQLALCQFFSFGQKVPVSIDVNPSNLWRYAYQFPPRGEFLVVNWLGLPALPAPLNPFSLAANLPAWFFFTLYTPVLATLALLAMAAFLRELGVPRPAALFGALVYAWQGDLLPFVFPGHYGYIGTWPFYAVAAWGALRSERTGHWIYALVSGAGCGVMVGLQPDRGGIASLLIAALYVAGAARARGAWLRQMGHLCLCVAAALVIALGALLALFQSYIVGVSMGGVANAQETYKFDTQFSLGPEETLTYLAPGFFGWASSSQDGPYWGRIGQWPDWPAKHQGTRNLNLAISTTGTVATALALLGAWLVVRGRVPGRAPASGALEEREIFYGRVLLAAGAAGLVLAWGYHTPLYRAVFALPLMDKWRDPLKWLELTNFALVALAALGVQNLMGTLGADETPELRRSRRWALGYMGAVLALLVAGLLASYPFTVNSVPAFQAAGYDPGSIASIMSTVHVSLLQAVAVMAGACLLLRLLWRPEALRRWKLENPWLHRGWHAMLEPERLPLTLALGLGALSVAQLGWVAAQFVESSDLTFLTATDPMVEALLAEGTAVRVSVAVHDPVLNVLLQNQLNTRRVSSLDISAASRIPDALNAFFGTLSPDPSRLWFLAGVKNRAMPESDFAALKNDPLLAANIERVSGYDLEPTPTPDVPSHALVEFRDYLAKATFVPGAETMALKAQLARLKDPKWDPRATVLLEAAPAPVAATAGTAAPPPATADLRTYTSRRIEVAVQAPQAGYILINDAWDPDWSAEVNGRPAPLLRADFLLRAVPVPAGASKVVLNYVAHYRPAGFPPLPAVAVNEGSDAAMLGAWIVAGVVLWRRRALDRT